MLRRANDEATRHCARSDRLRTRARDGARRRPRQVRLPPRQEGRRLSLPQGRPRRKVVQEPGRDARRREEGRQIRQGRQGGEGREEGREESRDGDEEVTRERRATAGGVSARRAAAYCVTVSRRAS